MDPITHGLVGLALSAFSGDPVSLVNPISLGCAIGAIAPDLDFVVRIFKDDAHYLKHHRGISHSVPFLGVFALGIAVALKLFFPEATFMSLWVWSFIGGLSHTFFDIMNSYGAQLFKKKKKLNILTLYDPILAAVGVYLIISPDLDRMKLFYATSISIIYLCTRWAFRLNAERQVEKEYHICRIEKVNVLPSLKAFYKWDFVVTTDKFNYVGQYNPFTKKVKEINSFQIENHEIALFFRKTNLGKAFGDFSPIYHISTEALKDGKTYIKATDLRYFFKNQFMHNATMIIDKEYNILESYMHPYSMKKKIPIYEY